MHNRVSASLGSMLERMKKLNSSRLSEIHAYISRHQKVTLTDLCEQFGVSMSTLRRDIKSLYERGLISKQYGSVSSREKELAAAPSPVKMTVPYHERSLIHPREKEITAKIAAGLVENNDVIFIDSGSTTAFMVDYLQHLEHIVIVTNNLDVVMRAQPYPHLDVYVLPGLYKRSNNSFSLLAESYIYDYYNITKAFLACSGISLTDGVSHFDLSERVIKNCTINHTKNCYLLVDHSKFGHTAPLHLCDIGTFTAICTDQRPSPEYVEYCEQHNVKLHYEETEGGGLPR